MRFLLYTVIVAASILFASVSNAQEYRVTHAGDDGPGSLRHAIRTANADQTGGTIVFDLDAGEPQVILLHSALPEVTAYNVTVNGSERKTNVVIALDGNGDINTPGIRFAEMSSSAVNIDYINFVDRDMFRDNPNDGVVLKVYPNPSSRSIVTVEVQNLRETGVPILVELLDLNGTSITSKFLENESLMVKMNLELKKDVPTGTYIVCVRVNERIYKQMLVMQ